MFLRSPPSLARHDRISFEHFNAHAGSPSKSKHLVALCGDFNVVPTDFDTYDTTSWKKNALPLPESRAAFAQLLDQGQT